MKKALRRTSTCFKVLFLTALLFSARPLLGQSAPVQDKLSNGIPVLYFEDTLRPLAHIALVVRAGSQIDAEGSDGVATLWSRAFWQRGEDSLQYAAFGRRRGILTSSQNGLSHTQFSMALPPWRMAAAFQLLGAALDDASYPGGNMDRARKDYAVLLQDLDNNPDVFLERQTSLSMWGDRFPEMHRYGYFPDLYGQSPKAYRQIHRTYLHPGNVMLIGNGPMPAAEFIHFADSLIGRWSSGKPAPYPPLAAMPDLPQSKYEVHTNEFAKTPKIRMSWAVPGAYEGPDAIRWAEWFTYAAQSRQGPFFDKLIRAGHASQFQWEYTPTRGPGQVNLTIAPFPEHIKECLVAVSEGLQALAETPAVWATISENINLNRTGQWAQWMDEPEELLYFVGRAWSSGVLEQALEVRGAVPEQEMMDYVSAYFSRQAHVAGLLVNSEYARLLGAEAIFKPVDPQIVSVAVVEDDPVVEPIVEPEPPKGISQADRDWLTALRVYFESSSFNPDSISLKGIGRVADIMRQNEDLRLHVNGYADGQGDGVYNYQLSIQRAESVKLVLEQLHGVSGERLVVKGWGEAFAEYPDDTPEHMALNRRVTFTLIEEKGDDDAL